MPLGTFGPAGFCSEKGAGDAFRAVIDADGKQRVRVIGGSYFFKPGHVRMGFMRPFNGAVLIYDPFGKPRSIFV